MLSCHSPITVLARKLGYDRPLIPTQKGEGKPAYITLHEYSNLFWSLVYLEIQLMRIYIHFEYKTYYLDSQVAENNRPL